MRYYLSLNGRTCYIPPISVTYGSFNLPKRKPTMSINLRSRLPITTLIATSLFVASATVSSQAQAVQRAHVSALVGLDSNTSFNCDVAHPCRFFQAAMTVVDPGGEVVVLDSGGYGAVTITQSISLIAPNGVYAGISVFPGGDGVTIATPGVNVVLRGLTINGQGGNNGINMTAGNSLTVDHCVISNLAQIGISVIGVIKAQVIDTTILKNGNYGVLLQDGVSGTISRATISRNTYQGIVVQAGVISTTAVDIADTTVEGSNTGVKVALSGANSLLKVSVRDSRIVQNVYGLLAISPSSGSANLSASNNMISNNAYGITASGPGVRVWASGNTVSDNTTLGLFNTSGALFASASNNAVFNNAADTGGTITAIATR